MKSRTHSMGDPAAHASALIKLLKDPAACEHFCSRH
jgi:hypothetical protein